MEDNSTFRQLTGAGIHGIFFRFRKTVLIAASGILFLILLLFYHSENTDFAGNKAVDQKVKDSFVEAFHNEFRTLENYHGDLIKKISQKGIGALTTDDNRNKSNSAAFSLDGKFIAGFSLLSQLDTEQFLKLKKERALILLNSLRADLAISSEINFQGSRYLLVSVTILDKFYSLKNQYDDPDNFFTGFEKKAGTTVSFTGSGSKNDLQLTSPDGRVLAVVTLENSDSNRIKSSVFLTVFRIFLFVASTLLLFHACYLFITGAKSKFRTGLETVKPGYLFPGVLIALFMVLSLRIFLLNFDAGILLGLKDFDNPANYSSPFGFGVAGSPVNLLITSFLGTIFTATLLSAVIRNNRKQSNHPSILAIRAVISIFLSVLLLRGFAAVQRSIVYDSSLRYFMGDSILPGKDVILMNISILMASFTLISLTVMFIASAINSLHLSLNRLKFASKPGILLPALKIIAVVVSILPGLLYFAVFEKEMILPLPSLLISLLLLVAVYFVLGKQNALVSTFLVIALISSTSSIILLSKFNEDLEKDSLKKIALEINRPTDTFMRFLVQQSLSIVLRMNVSPQDNEATLTGMAFRVWSGSILNGEVYPCKISIYKGATQKDIFSPFGIPSLNEFNDAPDTSLTDIAIRDSSVSEGKLITGAIPFAESDSTKYFAVVTILKRDFHVPGAGIPLFMRPETNPVNDIIDLRRMSIFKFVNDTPIGSFGAVQIPDKEIVKIRDKYKSGRVEELYRTTISGQEASIFYLLSNQGEVNSLTVLILKDKDPVRILFNFFKLFFLHSLFILLLLLVVAIVRFRKIYELFFRFRFQLTVSFMIMSAIPILALALFNRDNQASVDEKNRYFALKSRAEKVKQIVQTLEPGSTSLNLTGIPSSIYRDGKLFFISPNEAKAPFIPGYLQLPATSPGLVPVEDFFLTQHFDRYKYFSFSHSWLNNGKIYTVLVNDISDRDEQSLTLLEFDVFLFGVYSLAIILTSILATFISGRISSPLLKLTKATNSVALGNFDYDISSGNKGEIGELIRGFRYMTDELKKNQDEIALLEREAAWKEMAKQVAHEVKNPLTPMKLSVQHLLSAYKDGAPNLPELTEKILVSILKQIEILNQTASEFSRFAKMPGFQPHPVNISSLILEIKDLYTGSPLRFEFRSELENAFILGDESYFKRSMINLTKNAIQAGASSVTVKLIQIENEYELTVLDNGKGITEETASKIFEINFTTKVTGTGLGLKLTRRFVESVGGSIELLKSDEGTLFKMKFPVFKEKLD